MSIIYPPHIASTIPGFVKGTIKVPFTDNSAVLHYGGMGLVAYDLQNNKIATADATSTENNIAIFESFTFEKNTEGGTKQFNSGQYYKIQIAYLESNNSSTDDLYFSSASIGRCVADGTSSAPSCSVAISGFKATSTAIIGSLTSEIPYQYRFRILNDQYPIVITDWMTFKESDYDNNGNARTVYDINDFALFNGSNKIYFDIKTINGYEASSTGVVLTKLNFSSFSDDNITITPVINYDEGWVELSISGINSHANYESIDIVRALEGSTVWETIHTFSGVSEIKCLDKTTESGLSYKYGLIGKKVDSDGNVSYGYCFNCLSEVVITSPNIFKVDLDNYYILGKNKIADFDMSEYYLHLTLTNNIGKDATSSLFMNLGQVSKLRNKDITIQGEVEGERKENEVWIVLYKSSTPITGYQQIAEIVDAGLTEIKWRDDNSKPQNYGITVKSNETIANGTFTFNPPEKILKPTDEGEVEVELKNDDWVVARIYFPVYENKGAQGGWKNLQFKLNDSSTTFYSYSQRAKNKTEEGVVTVGTPEATPYFEDAFLIEGDKQLKIRFNPKVSSFKDTILEAKQDTIGGKYPFFFRNGDVRYKEIPISGLISYQMDDNQNFMSDEELGLDSDVAFKRRTTGANNYAALKTRTTSLADYNIAAERKFKIAVLEWLNNGKPKLFKSPTEGNYIVRLMNVSLTPEDKLGRMLHSFSATGYECMEINEENLRSLGIVRADTQVNTSNEISVAATLEPGIENPIYYKDFGTIYNLSFTDSDDTDDKIVIIFSKPYRGILSCSFSPNSFKFDKDMPIKEIKTTSKVGTIINSSKTPTIVHVSNKLNTNLYLDMATLSEEEEQL